MTASPFQFQCPHCAQLLEIEDSPEGQIVQCSICSGEVLLERKAAATRPIEASLMHPVEGSIRRLLFPAAIGAVIGYALTYSVWLTLVGALVGGLFGQRRIRQTARRLENDPRWLRWQALAGLRSTAISWIVLALMWSWVLTRPRETFNDQGGLLLTLFVLPLTLALWILGGPVAFARGWRNRWRATSPAVDGWVIVGLVQSGLLMLAGFVFVQMLGSELASKK